MSQNTIGFHQTLTPRSSHFSRPITTADPCVASPPDGHQPKATETSSEQSRLVWNMQCKAVSFMRRFRQVTPVHTDRSATWTTRHAINVSAWPRPRQNDPALQTSKLTQFELAHIKPTQLGATACRTLCTGRSVNQGVAESQNQQEKGSSGTGPNWVLGWVGY